MRRKEREGWETRSSRCLIILLTILLYFTRKLLILKVYVYIKNKCTGNFTTRDNLMLIYILHTNNYYYNIIIKLIILRRCSCCRQLLPVSYVYVSCYMYTYLSLCALFVIPFLCLCNNIFLKIIGFLQE